VFERALVTRTERIIEALKWCLDQRMDVVNLSIGSTAIEQRPVFERIVQDGRQQHMLIVAPARNEGGDALPGCIPGTVSVEEDPRCPRGEYRVFILNGQPRFYCAGHPRPIPRVPAGHNLSGISFAVANMTGFVARALEHVQFGDVEEHFISLKTSF
jgi:hypothetical protein